MRPEVLKLIADGVVSTVKHYVSETLRPIERVLIETAARVGALEAKLATPERGEKGEKGDPGAPGERGPAGADGKDGRDGAPGEKGERGEKGDPGAPGRDGVDGKDGAPGERGEKGEPGERGEKGDRGEPGRDGKDGAPGLDGKDGAPGERGERGEKGDPGDPGEPGRDGKDGSDGRDGKDGRDGIDGRDAADINPLPSIDEARSYSAGTWACHDGGLWRADVKTNGMAGWRCCVYGLAEFRQEQDERTVRTFFRRSGGELEVHEARYGGVLDRGVFKEGTVYEVGDGVTWAGSYWIAQKTPATDKPGSPSEHWRLAVKRGRDGGKR